MLQFGSTLIPAEYEPPRPSLSPAERVVVLRRGAAGLPDYREDWGMRNWTLVRFASSANQGFMTAAEVTAIMALYEAGAPFTLTTDLLKPLGGAADAYSAYFDPAVIPAFVPADPGGTLYYFDLLLLVDA